MSLFAMLFPGQGSQSIGMSSSFLHIKNHIFQNTFEEASDCIKCNLISLVQNGPREKLNLNQYTQVSILTASVAIYRFWKSQNNKSPLIMAGHSLGEYSALVCANSIKFSDAIKIVFFRGKIMEKFSKNRSFLTKAVIGLNKNIVQNACLMASKKKK